MGAEEMKDHLMERIKRHEGFRARVYNDKYGYPTIGYGFKIDSLVLDKRIAEVILLDIVYTIRRELANHIWYNQIPADVQEVAVEMAYQMGVTGLLNFKRTIEFWRTGKWEEAYTSMMQSKWAKEDSPERAKELAEIVRSQK